MFFLGRCFTFWYFITGNNAGTLSIYVQDINTNTSIIIWQDGGSDLGNQWNYGTFGFYYDKPYSIRIVAENGASTGVIAIDDLVFQESKYCAVIPAYAQAGTGLPIPSKPITTTKNPITSLPSVYDCSFEKDYCQWTNDTTRPLYWIRNNGQTGTYETGPTTDHT